MPSLLKENNSSELKSVSEMKTKQETKRKPIVDSHQRVLTDELNWPTILFLLITPILGLYGVLTTPFDYRTYLVALITYISGGMAITAGYHRLFAHRAYDIWYPLKVLITIAGTQTFEGSVFEWCMDHRDHHRFTDTDLDPYNAKRGFFFSHMGWLFYKRDRDRIIKSDISDLKADPFLQFQHEYYTPLAFFLGFFLPMFICGFGWGDWKGGLLIAGIFSKVMIMQNTFCINSVAHMFGDLTYSDQRTPRDWIGTSLLTFGEGYHNFHHEFPYDYRNGIVWYAFDPTKWLIRIWEMFGLAVSVKRMPTELIAKGKIQMKQKLLDEEKAKLDWGPQASKLPLMSRSEFDDLKGNVILIDNMIYDITPFLNEHPGGRAFLISYLGKDASNAFNGGVYNHSNAARNRLNSFAIAQLTNA